jgi:DNA primase
LQADLRVAAIPDELDPDEIVARDKEEWANIIANAKPIVTHVMDSLAVGQNLNDPKIKNQIAAQVLPLIDDIANPLERDTYRQALARMLRVNESALAGEPTRMPVMRRKPRGEVSNIKIASTVVAVNPRLKIEAYCLGNLLKKPELVYRLDRKLEEYGLSPLAVEDFEYTDHQLLFGVLRLAVEQDEKEHQNYLLSHVPEALNSLTTDLLLQIEKMDAYDDKLAEDLLTRFLDLRRTHASANVNQLRFLQEDDVEQGGGNLQMYQEQTMQFTRLLRSLDIAKQKISKRQ